MKRKASYLDGENDISSWIPRSSDSSTSSFTSPDRACIKPASRVAYSSSSTNNANGPNPRTRKRHRDNRPDANMIHQNTLAKLYNAQKFDHQTHSDHEKPTPSILDSIPSQREDHQHTPTQRSLHSFFNIRQPQPATISPTPLRQHTQDTPDLCSGCGNCLLSDSSGPSGDHDIMDIDHNSGAFVNADYGCASCQRLVCDTCAVRGDQRICLECALPGAG